MKAKQRLDGKVAIVTGGASGIGKALGEELASRGCKVVLADRQIDLAGEVAAHIGDKASAHELDVRDPAAFDRLVEEVAAREKKIDFLFNNAGIGVGGEVANYEQADFDDVFDVNLRGVAHGILAVYRIMRRQGSGYIVNTASVAGLVAAPGNASYSATKHAVVALSKVLRMEAKRYGVSVSVLCPGAIRTPILTGGRYGRTGLVNATEDLIMKQWNRARPIEPAELATKALDRVLAGDAIIVIPRWWKIFWYLDRISPSLSMALGERSQAALRRSFEADGIGFKTDPKAR